MCSDRCDQKFAIQAAVFYIYTTDRIIKFHTNQKSLMSYFFYMWKFFQFGCKVVTDFFRISCKISVKKFVNFCKCCRTAYRMSAKCSSVGTCRKCFCNFCCRTDCTDRHAAAKCFRHRNDIWFDSVVHIRHYCTGSAPSGLYLIDQKKHIILITEFTKSLHKFHCCRMYTAFSLYRLNHDCNGVFGTCIFKCLQIIIRCIRESVCHRSETNLASVSRLTGCGHGTEGSSMEAHLCSYDMVTVRSVFFYAIFTCHFDHRFVCFCTGVLIKDLVHADRLAHFLGK